MSSVLFSKVLVLSSEYRHVLLLGSVFHQRRTNCLVQSPIAPYTDRDGRPEAQAYRIDTLPPRGEAGGRPPLMDAGKSVKTIQKSLGLKSLRLN